MRKALKDTEEWLNRSYHLFCQVEANRRMLDILSNRLESSVSKYETDGTDVHDVDKSKQRRDYPDARHLAGRLRKDFR